MTRINGTRPIIRETDCMDRCRAGRSEGAVEEGTETCAEGQMKRTLAKLLWKFSRKYRASVIKDRLNSSFVRRRGVR
jgi:hypothetical protein